MIVLLIIFRNRIVSLDNIRNKGIYIFIIIVCLIFVVWLWYKFVPYIKDLKAVRSHNFSYFTEEVIEYKKRKAIGDIAVSNKYLQPINSGC